MTVAQPHFKRVLASFRRAVSRRVVEDDGSLPDDVLCALLLTVAARSNSAADCLRLFELTERLAPPDIRGAFQFPSKACLSEAEKLLPLAPHLVADAEPHILGFLFQFASAPKRAHAQQTIQTANKSASLAEIISFTQLHTPASVINTLLRDVIPDNISPQFRLLDPAVGAGNFLVAAYNRLRLKLSARHALQCLFGCDIDRSALWVACLSLASHVLHEPDAEELPSLNLALVLKHNCCELGTLDRDWPANHCLNQSYDAVVGNPPYLGRKLLNRQLKERLRSMYPDAHQDLCTAFIARGLELLKQDGKLAFITQTSLLFLPTYERLRMRLAANYSLMRIEEAGTSVFPLQTGEKVNSVLLTVRNSACEAEHSVLFVDRKAGIETRLKQTDLMLQPKATFNYRCPPAFIHIKQASAPLDALTEIRQGLATSDNKRFIKYRREVPEDEIGVRWIPYVKGGGSERWYAPIDTVIDWADNGAAVKRAVAEAYPYLNGKINWVVKNEQFYFREGLTFSLVNTRQLAVRYMPGGCIFDVGGSALFPEEHDRWWLLAYLNSSFVAACAGLLNPTINFQVGDLKQLPVVSLAVPERKKLATLAQECVELKKQLFVDSLSANAAEEITDQIVNAEAEIDELVLSSARRAITCSQLEWRRMAELCTNAVGRRRPNSFPESSRSRS